MAPRPASPKRPHRVFVRVERWILSVGMGLMAFVIERQLLKALKRGGVTSAPRTAAGHGHSEEVPDGGVPARAWEVSRRGGGITASPREEG